jgi:hypothetical protein
VTGHCHFETAAERGAVHRDHQWLGQILHALQDVVHLRQPRVAAPRQLFETLDVGAGNERASRADEHGGANRRIPSHFVDGRRKAIDHTGAERVDRWVVDRDERDLVVRCNRDWRVLSHAIIIANRGRVSSQEDLKGLAEVRCQHLAFRYGPPGQTHKDRHVQEGVQRHMRADGVHRRDRGRTAARCIRRVTR